MRNTKYLLFTVCICCAFLLLLFFALSVFGIVDMRLFYDIEVPLVAQFAICIIMYFVNIFVIYKVAFIKMEKSVWVNLALCFVFSNLLFYLFPQISALISNTLIFNLFVVVGAIIFNRQNFKSILFRLGLFNLISLLYTAMSNIIKFNYLGLDLYQDNIIAMMVYSIDLYLVYFLLYRTVKSFGLEMALESMVRRLSVFKKVCKEILKNRKSVTEDVSDLNASQRRVFGFLALGYMIFQSIIIIGVTFLISNLFYLVGGFYLGILEFIVSWVALEIFRLVLGKTMHFDKPSICIVVSFLIFFAMSRFALPFYISMFFNVLIAAIIASIIHILVTRNDDYEDLQEYKRAKEAFSLTTCNYHEFCERCRERGVQGYLWGLAFDMLVNEMPAKIAASKYNYAEVTVKKYKQKIYKQIL